jgi:hypothetical protein
MIKIRLVRAALAAAMVVVSSPARAQMFEAIGIRAQGMSGAFVAVADDATATWWNPAGVATGPYFDALVEYDQPRSPSDAPTAKGFAIAFPALGLSYYRLPVSQMRSVTSTGSPSNSREDQGYLSQYGATVGQSLGNHLVIATTLKLVRAGETHGDVDAGAIATLGHVRVGVAVRNLRKPSFGDGEDALALTRQGRIGVAVFGRGRGPVDEMTVAVDADVTEAPTMSGDARHVAAGGELWLFRRAVGVRGGVATDTISDRGSASGGLSLLFQSSRYTRTYVDGQLTGGSDETRRGWGVSLRVTF